MTFAIDARADLTLNDVGTAAGFTLSSFYEDPAVTYGLVGSVGVGGTAIGSGHGRNALFKLNDVDGQCGTGPDLSPGVARRLLHGLYPHADARSALS